MANVQTYIGGQEVIASGVLLLDEMQKEARVLIDGFRFIFNFVEKVGAAEIQSVPTVGNEVLFNLIGWNNPLPTMWTAKNVARMNTKPMHLTLSVSAVGEKGAVRRVLHYTFTVEA